MTEPSRNAVPATPELEAGLASFGFAPREMLPLPGDVSRRRYFRASFASGGTAVLATYPPEVRDVCSRFLRTTEILESARVRVPRVLASDCAAGWMLVEDLGPQTLGEWGMSRPWNEVGACFEHALELADRVSRLSPQRLEDLNPRLSGELLQRELAQTWDLFLEPQGLVRDPGLARALRAGLDTVCERLDSEPPVPCHRDFMVRNLIPLSQPGKLGVLDHQDLRLGPPLYDLASLLNDTLFPPPEAERALLAAMAPGPGDRERYQRAAAQRTLKAVGTYASFARRGATRHLPLIGPTLARFVEHFASLPEGEGLAGRLGEAWSPALAPPRH